MLGWVLTVGFAFLLAYGFRIHQSLVRQRQSCEMGLEQLLVHLKRRHEIIPNFVNTVRGIMEFEIGTLSKLLEARVHALSAHALDQRFEFEAEISRLILQLWQVWGNYADLKTNTSATRLRAELAAVEVQISNSRENYNLLASTLNQLIEQMPSNLVASLAHFNPKPLFPVSDVK